jgi:hypothetical protein
VPITPLHMGPGMVVKAVLGARFSLIAFGVAQVAIDIEPIVAVMRGSAVLHGWTHTYAGATLIAALAVPIARPVAIWIVPRWNRELRHHQLDWLEAPETVGYGPIAAGAFIGTWSHVAIDSIMHSDMHPFAPLSPSNALLDAIPMGALDLACVIAGFVGVAAWLLVARARRAKL